MDLNETPPRPGNEVLGGWVWLPRMIDKARATYAGDPGDYRHPCGRDYGLLAEMGVSLSEFREIIENTETDDQVLEELKRLREHKGLV